MKALRSVQNVILQIMKVLCIISFVIMILLVGAQVIVRFVIKNAFDMSWSEELVRYILCWSTFLGTTVLYESHGHVWVENLVNSVPRAIRTILLVVSYLVQILFFVTVLYGSIQYLPVVAKQTSNVMHIRLDLVYIVIPITAAVCLLFCIRDLILFIKGKGDVKNG